MSTAPAVRISSDITDVARKLKISEGAVQLTYASDLIDLHLDTFIARRIFGFDVNKRHEGGLLGRHFMGHVDVPRLREGGVTGGMWSITTNPFRSPASRWQAYQRNVLGLQRLVESSQGSLRFAQNVSQYRGARAAGAHAVFAAVQGGNAFEAAPAQIESLASGLITRVTLVHLLSSIYGATSVPVSLFRRQRGLTERGRQLVWQLNAHRVFVDLAHIHPQSFWDAVAAHDRTQPLIVTHTGVSAVTPHWRNLDDEQLKAIANTGGVIGVMLQSSFLKRAGGPVDGRMMVEHLDHIRRVVGEDFVAIGSDYDGMISPPIDLEGVQTYPRLVQHLLTAGWTETAIQKALGGNFLRALGQLRP
jgi:membrane dipeptidase